MQSDSFYILTLIGYCLVIGFVVPRLFKLKFLPIGYLVLAAASTILGFILQLNIYGDSNIWESPIIGMFWATVVCFGITTVIFFIRRSKPKLLAESTGSHYENIDIQAIKSLISNNDIENACEKLLALTKTDRKKNDELLLIKRKIQKIKSDNRIGVLTNEEKDIGYSRISYSLLEITNSL